MSSHDLLIIVLFIGILVSFTPFLGKWLAIKPDVLILDEPTNNLDIQSIEIITSTIRDYTGTVLVVSHDKYFINEIGVERKIIL